jgi:hypothetical protein
LVDGSIPSRPTIKINKIGKPLDAIQLVEGAVSAHFRRRRRTVATIVETPSGSWKALVCKEGWPTTVKAFRTKRDAEDWSRRTED